MLQSALSDARWSFVQSGEYVSVPLVTYRLVDAPNPALWLRLGCQLAAAVLALLPTNVEEIRLFVGDFLEDASPSCRVGIAYLTPAKSGL